MDNNNSCSDDVMAMDIDWSFWDQFTDSNNSLALGSRNTSGRPRASRRRTSRLRENRNSSPGSSNNVVVNNAVVGHEGSGVGRNSIGEHSSHLVDMNMEMDLDVEKDGDGGYASFYDCSICLEMAKEPIVTCCGHLFCWACFYQVRYVYSGVKECPVCKGMVKDNNVTPIYGNADSDHVVSELESGIRIPPRPAAHRVESARQQLVNQRVSQTPVADVVRRIRLGIGIGLVGGTEESQMQNNLESVNAGSGTTSQVSSIAEEVRIRRAFHSWVSRGHQLLSTLPESSATHSSISSANNAERLN